MMYYITAVFRPIPLIPTPLLVSPPLSNCVFYSWSWMSFGHTPSFPSLRRIRHGERTGPNTSARTILHSTPRNMPPSKLKSTPERQIIISYLQEWLDIFFLSFSIGVQSSPRVPADISRKNFCRKFRKTGALTTSFLRSVNSTAATFYACMRSISFIHHLGISISAVWVTITGCSLPSLDRSGPSFDNMGDMTLDSVIANGKGYRTAGRKVRVSIYYTSLSHPRLSSCTRRLSVPTDRYSNFDMEYAKINCELDGECKCLGAISVHVATYHILNEPTIQSAKSLPGLRR